MEKKSFNEILSVSAEDLKVSRVNNFVKNAQAAAEALIQSKKRSVRELEDEIDNLMDLGDDSTTDVAKKVRVIDIDKLIRNIFVKRIELKEAQEDLAEMEKVYEELFPQKKNI